MAKLARRIVYLASRNQDPREHLFAPARLLASQETIYIEGWLLNPENPRERKYDDPLRLALQRFESCELTDISSAKLPPLPPKAYDVFGLKDREPFEAKILFAPEAAAYAGERIWSKNQRHEKREDGSLILTVMMGNYREELACVLGFGKSATVLEPDWFVKSVRMESREAIRNYAKARSEGSEGAAKAFLTLPTVPWKTPISEKDKESSGARYEQASDLVFIWRDALLPPLAKLYKPKAQVAEKIHSLIGKIEDAFQQILPEENGWIYEWDRLGASL